MKPESKLQWDTHRAKMSCKIGRQALNGELVTPPGGTDKEYALYCLLSAIEDIANAIEKLEARDV
jgi:hypothetical protein